VTPRAIVLTPGTTSVMRKADRIQPNEIDKPPKCERERAARPGITPLNVP